MMFGFVFCIVGLLGFVIFQYYVYKILLCGFNVMICVDIFFEGLVIVFQVLYLWYFIFVIVNVILEIFVNVMLYGIVYSWLFKNMKGFVLSFNLMMVGVLVVVGLVFLFVIKDFNLIWVFVGLIMVGVVMMVFFYFIFQYIDKEEFVFNMGGELDGLDVEGKQGIGVFGEKDRV